MMKIIVFLIVLTLASSLDTITNNLKSKSLLHKIIRRKMIRRYILKKRLQRYHLYQYFGSWWALNLKLNCYANF